MWTNWYDGTTTVEGTSRDYARLLEAQEAERKRIARELHDEIGQSLTALRLMLEQGLRLPEAGVKSYVHEAIKVANHLMGQVRNLSLDLRPAMLDDLGLLPALNWYFKRYTAQTGIAVRFEHRGVEERFSTLIETTTYRIIQEALTNVARYAGVDQVEVLVESDGAQIWLHVRDEGRGFDTASALAACTSGGLLGMRERVMLVRGDLEVKSAPGRGTGIHARLPFSQELDG